MVNAIRYDIGSAGLSNANHVADMLINLEIISV